MIKMKYICDECGEPCILEVENDASVPTGCPYEEMKYPYWHILKEE